MLAAAALGLAIFGVGFYFKNTSLQPTVGGSIVIGINGSPRFLNPVLCQVNDTDSELVSIVFSGLFKRDGQGQLIFDLAKDYQIGDNGKIYEITLKDNVQWHDKKLLTADDVIFTLRLIQNQDFHSPLRPAWQGIEIEKISDSAVRFILKKPYANFLSNLTVGILPQHLWKNVIPAQFTLNELNLKPIGSGPYLFRSLQKDKNGAVKTLGLKSFADYFAGRPLLDNLIFNFYNSEEELYAAAKKDELNAFGLVTAKQLSDPIIKDSVKFNITSVSLPRYFAIFFNQNQNKILTDKNVRQALALGTDRQTLIDQVFKGYGQLVNSPLTPGMTGFIENTSAYNFSPDQAQAALETAGWQDTDQDNIREKNNEKLEITLTSIDWPELSQTAELIKKQWEALGFKVNLQIIETDKIQNDVIKPRQYQALLFGEVLGFEPDLFHFWHSSGKKDSGLNLAMYEHPEVDRLLSQAMENPDQNSRAQKYQQAVAQIIADVPAIFLFSPDYLFITTKNIQGLALQKIDLPAACFAQIYQWYIKTSRQFN